MNTYQTEQLEALTLIRRHLGDLSKARIDRLHARIDDYLAYRRRMAHFLSDHFKNVCTRECFSNRRSACCGKDSIITFFAEVLINALLVTARSARPSRKAASSAQSGT